MANPFSLRASPNIGARIETPRIGSFGGALGLNQPMGQSQLGPIPRVAGGLSVPGAGIAPTASPALASVASAPSGMEQNDLIRMLLLSQFGGSQGGQGGLSDFANALMLGRMLVG